MDPRNTTGHPDSMSSPVRADQAAQRIAAHQAERRARAIHAARLELEAQIQAQAGHQAQAWDEIELEL